MSTVTGWRPGIIVAAADLSPELIIAIKLALTREQVVALTAWGEARSRYEPHRGWVANPLDAMVDIVSVIENRRRDPRWARYDVKGICFQRWAFSCWEPTAGADTNRDPRHLADNFEALMTQAQQLLADHEPPDMLLGCLAAAEAASVGAVVDTLGASTHYYAVSMPAPPPWAFEDKARTTPRAFVCERFGHRFYNNVP